MVLRRLITAMVVLGMSLSASAHSDMKAENCIPENDLYIPTFVEGQGVTKAEFDDVIDRVESIYAPVIRNLGGQLVVKRKWDNGTVNASANRDGSNYIVNMFGGLARHRVMTKDGLTLVICHELGHHIGGAPKIGNRWATNEGQSDYFAGLKCMRRVFAMEDSVRIIQRMDVDPVAKKECEKTFNNSTDQAICMRSAMAGYTAAMMFRDLRKEQRMPKFDTPDQSKVEKTYHGHPATQCRMDTYLAGDICGADVNVDVSDKDVHVGLCSRKFGDSRGARPLCWYSEENPAGAILRMANN
jgi:hypothetical protein